MSVPVGGVLLISGALLVFGIVAAVAVAASHPRGRRRGSPVLVRPPTIRGVPSASTTLTAGRGHWRSKQPVSYAFQWQRCYGSCVTIPGADRPRYRLAAADVGLQVRVTVIASDAAGKARSRSRPTPTVDPSSRTLARGVYTQLLPRIDPTNVALELVTGGYELPFTPTIPGTLQIAWRLGSHAGSGTEIVDGAATFDRTGPGQVRLELTGPGRTLIQRLHGLTVTAVATYRAGHIPAVSTSRTFVLG